MNVLILLIFLSSGTYKERVKAETLLIESSITYAQAKALYKLTESEPESHERLKKIALNKWCIETNAKYTGLSYFPDSNPTILVELQEKDFLFDLKRD
jgi:hypothetical protein